MLVSNIKCQEKLKKSVDKWMHLQYNITCSERIGTLKTPKWRNWQTHLTQNQAGSRSCRFESGLRHQDIPRFFERGTVFYILNTLLSQNIPLGCAFRALCLTIILACAIIYCVPGVQLSLVEHLIWDQDVAGSSPVTPTKNLRVQFSGKTSAFQADVVGSIPIARSNIIWSSSSVGQSNGLLSRGSGVRIPPGSPSRKAACRLVLRAVYFFFKPKKLNKNRACTLNYTH